MLCPAEELVTFLCRSLTVYREAAVSGCTVSGCSIQFFTSICIIVGNAVIQTPYSIQCRSFFCKRNFAPCLVRCFCRICLLCPAKEGIAFPARYFCRNGQRRISGGGHCCRNSRYVCSISVKGYLIRNLFCNKVERIYLLTTAVHGLII